MDGLTHLARVQQLVKEFRDTPNSELEVRFGTMDKNDRFVADVGHHVYDTLYNVVFDNNTDGTPLILHDVFFTQANMGEVRTRVIFDDSWMNLHHEHCMKRKLKEVIFRTNRPDCLGFKVSLSMEIPVDPELLDDMPSTTHFRNRGRRVQVKCF
eukprot:scaffold211735_cov26-Tisochrysis_lutea.AAC.1